MPCTHFETQVCTSLCTIKSPAAPSLVHDHVAQWLLFAPHCCLLCTCRLWHVQPHGRLFDFWPLMSWSLPWSAWIHNMIAPVGVCQKFAGKATWLALWNASSLWLYTWAKVLMHGNQARDLSMIAATNCSSQQMLPVCSLLVQLGQVMLWTHVWALSWANTKNFKIYCAAQQKCTKFSALTGIHLGVFSQSASLA